MNKALLLFVFVITSYLSFSQAGYNAVGLKAGYSNGVLLEVSYQYEYSLHKRIEADMGVYFNQTYMRSGFTFVHQWRYFWRESFSWYIGGGTSVGYWDYSKNYHHFDDNGYYLSLALNAGIEYAVPFYNWRFTLDVRPEFRLLGSSPGEDFYPQLALGVRYMF